MNMQHTTPVAADEPMWQALSAWMDGAPLPPGTNEQRLLDWLLANDAASTAWQQWHLAGDALRLNQPLVVSTAAPHAVGTLQWGQQLQQRLAQTTAASLQADVLADPAHNPVPQASALPVHRPQAVGSQRPPLHEAANAPVWRWKMAAGFASVAAAGLLGWNLLMLQPGVTQNQATPQAAGAALLAAGDGAALVDSGLPVAPSDPDLNRLLVAHAQLDGQALLPESSLSVEDDLY